MYVMNNAQRNISLREYVLVMSKYSEEHLFVAQWVAQGEYALVMKGNR